jgi:hypothetical protein
MSDPLTTLILINGIVDLAIRLAAISAAGQPNQEQVQAKLDEVRSKAKELADLIAAQKGAINGRSTDEPAPA